MEVKKGQLTVMEAERRNNLYYLLAEAVSGDSNSVSIDDLKLWHERLGHPAEGSLKELIKSGIIPGDTSSNLGPCEHCVLGKAKRTPFPTGTDKARFMHRFKVKILCIWGANVRY